MPTSHLCTACRQLHLSEQDASPHDALHPVLNLGGHWLFRCNQCGAFASRHEAQGSWSFNMLGQCVPPQDVPD